MDECKPLLAGALAVQLVSSGDGLITTAAVTIDAVAATVGTDG